MVVRLSVVLVKDVRGYVGGQQGVGRHFGGKELAGEESYEGAVRENARQYYDYIKEAKIRRIRFQGKHMT